MEQNRWQHISQVLEASLEHETGSRAQFLAEACGGDEELRREIDSLLAFEPELKHFLETPVLEQISQSQTAKPEPSLVGQQIGIYKIVSQLGVGGMGEVYRALDTRLDRTVALKILPAEVAQDQDRMRQFIREARAASALNHSNICTIHHVGESIGIHFIVMEYVEGETLAQQMEERRSPIVSRKSPSHPQEIKSAEGKPLEKRQLRLVETSEILDLGIQVADALEEAHSKGVTHRDIKPGNIMLTPRRRVKVLDFGLAKMTRKEGETTRIDLKTPTRVDAGLIRGTVSYMSPEQVLGREVDYRSDLFSLGAVLYEMATGRLPFAGTTSTETMDMILHAQPEPIAKFRHDLPAELVRIIKKLLEKNRERRYQSAREIGVDLRNLKQDSKSGIRIFPLISARHPLAPLRIRHSALRIGIPVIFLLLIGAMLWSYYSSNLREKSAPRLRAFEFTGYPGVEGSPAFSPDGKQVAFSWDSAKRDNFDIYVRYLDEVVPQRLTNHPDIEYFPAWSPDGQWIAFRRLTSGGSDIVVMSARGGKERLIASTTVRLDHLWYLPLSWTKDGKFIIATDKTNPQALNHCIYRFPLEMGRKEQLTFPLPNQDDISSALSPDGKMLAFARGQNIGEADIYLLFLDPSKPGREPQRLTSEMQEIEGLAWAPNGQTIIYSSNRGGALRTLWKISARGGNPEPLIGIGDDAYFPSVAASGDRLIYQRLIFSSSIWRIKEPGSKAKLQRHEHSVERMVSPSQKNFDPQFSPDGKRIAFTSAVNFGIFDLWLSDTDGSSLMQLTHLRSVTTFRPRWSPDSTQIAFASSKEGNLDIWVVSAAGGAPRLLTKEKSVETRPSWSRDGRWIYFASDRGGGFQVWKIRSEGGTAVRVTRKGGFMALESPDARWVYYDKSGQDGIWKIPVSGGEETEVVNEARSGFWAIADEGLFLLHPDTKEGPKIELFKFATRKLETIMTLRDYFGPSTLFDNGLDVTADGSWIIFSMIEFPESSLVMVENFR